MGKSLIIMGANFSANAVGSLRAAIAYELTTCETSAAPTSVRLGAGIEVRFSDANYHLPSTVAVTYTDSGDAVSGASYDATTGVLTIDSVDADITIAATGTAYQNVFTEADIETAADPTPADGLVGGIKATNGEYVGTGFNSWRASGFINVRNCSGYDIITNSTAGSFGLAWYDDQKQYISGIVYNSSLPSSPGNAVVMTKSGNNYIKSGDIPTGAKYFRYCCYSHAPSGDGGPKTVTVTLT